MTYFDTILEMYNEIRNAWNDAVHEVHRCIWAEDMKGMEKAVKSRDAYHDCLMTIIAMF